MFVISTDESSKNYTINNRGERQYCPSRNDLVSLPNENPMEYLMRIRAEYSARDDVKQRLHFLARFADTAKYEGCMGEQAKLILIKIRDKQRSLP